MNIEGLNKSLNEYFEYIRTIYLNEYGKYLNNETLEYIKNLKDIFEFDEELSFKVIVEDKIKFNLNVNKFISENNLLNKDNYVDIDAEEKAYIAYLIKNRNNVVEIIKNKVLEEILKLFMRNDDVLTVGTISIIKEKLASKYKLPTEKFIECKEKEIALYIESIVGENTLLEGVLNDDDSSISRNYNLYVEDKYLETYNEIMSCFNKIYKSYTKKLGKVFYTDSLYEYQKLDYNLEEKTNDIKEEKESNNRKKMDRIISIKKCLMDMCTYVLQFSQMEMLEIKNSLVEVNKSIEKITENSADIDFEYKKILEIEDSIMKYNYRIWNSSLTTVDDYLTNGEFTFIMENNKTDKMIDATLVSDKHLKSIKTLKYNYGFIYGINKNSIIYASTNNFMCKETKQENYNTINHGNISIDIDDQTISKLITPTVIVEDNIKKNMIQNKIILDKRNVVKIGVYCFLEDELENSSNYIKALELSENYELPIIKIDKDKYFEGIVVSENKQIKKVEVEAPKESLFDKIKKAKDKILYDEDINEFKKTL